MSNHHFPKIIYDTLPYIYFALAGYTLNIFVPSSLLFMVCSIFVLLNRRLPVHASFLTLIYSVGGLFKWLNFYD
jgi:hypothetical protein